MSGVGNPELAVAIDLTHEGIDAALAAGAEPADGRDAVVVLRELDVLRRRVDALQVAALDAIDRRKLHHGDGHVSAKVMAQHVCRLSHAEAGRRRRAMKACRDLPALQAQWRAGKIGSDQVAAISRLYANPRVRDHLPRRLERFLVDAARDRYVDFDAKLRDWERLIDMDGPAPPAQRAHESRDVKLVQDYDQTWTLSGGFSPLMGAAINEVLEHYVRAEWLADWEKAKAEHGDAANDADLGRTPQQRRADAFWQLCQDAPAAGGSAVPARFVHTIVWSERTYAAMLDRLDGSAAEPLDPDTHRCETIDGIALDPLEAASASLWGHVRRAVVDAAGVVIDLGRSRAFTGAARTAAALNSTHCVWPGCHRPTSACEIDHLHAHGEGGATNPANAAPLCGRHNRWKQKRFSIHRSPDGTYTTLRPDGTRLE